MKKIIKIIALVFAGILALLIILPVVFKGRIIEQVKIVINENVNAVVDFDSLGISFIRSFPDVSLTLRDLSIIGKDHFEGETLANIRRFHVSVDLLGLIGGTGYEIKTISIDGPQIYLKILKDGTANWDIAVAGDEKAEEKAVKDDGPSDFNLHLRRFTIKDAKIVYDDHESNTYARLENFNHTLRGDFTAGTTDLRIRNTYAEKLFFSMDGVPMLNNVYADFRANIFADLNAMKFTFKDNLMQLNDLHLAFDGNFSMPDEHIIIDLTFNAPRTSFKSILSMVPAIYAQGFEGLKTDGTIELTGHIRGDMRDDHIPGFDLNIIIADGMFKYPDLPGSVDNINIIAKFYNPGGNKDLTVIDISRFSLKISENPVDFKLNLKTPVSDPHIDALLKGKIDLGVIKDIYPLEEGQRLAGTIESNVLVRGNLSSIEKQRFNDFKFDGSLTVRGMEYMSEDFPTGIMLEEMELRFSPRVAELRSFRSIIGDSDLSAKGKVNNVPGFLLKGEMLTGSFQTSSKYFNLNHFMGPDPEGPVEDPESMELAVIEIPENIDFTLSSRFDRVIYGNLNITNVNGVIKISDQTLRMQDLSMNMLNGMLVMNGSYNTREPESPAIDLGLDIRQFDIQSAFNAFNTFAILAPIGSQAHGRISSRFSLKGRLNEKLIPVMNTLSGSGSFNSASIKIENSPALTGLASNLKMDIFKDLRLRDISARFEFRDGRVELKPFDMKFGNSVAKVSGSHFFDQTINYLMDLKIPRSEFGSAANQVLEGLVRQAASAGLRVTPGETVNIGVAFTGTVTDPVISINILQRGTDIREHFRDQVRQAVDDVTEQISEELEIRARQIVEEAERQAENIKREAAIRAQAIREEARVNAKRLEDEARSSIERRAARRAGEELIKKADTEARRLEDEAAQRADRIVREAEERARRIRTGKE